MFDIISGSSHELRKKGYFLGLLDLDRSKEKAEEQIINAIQSKKADGILINGYYVTPAIEKVLLATDFPHICIGKPSFDSMLSWIDTNHSLSSNLAITHLVSLGHKKLPSSAVLTKTIFTEIVSWDIGCLSSATISHPEMLMSSLLLPIWKRSSNIPRSFCDYRNLPTAFCALTALSPSASSRQSVSSACAFRMDISIVSFDNYPYAPLITPSLTVVDIDMYSLGTRAGASLLKKIQNPEMLIQTYTALPHLIQRDSTVLHSET